MSGRFYIRIRGRKTGPLTVEEVHALGKRGRFGRHYEVSVDGTTWLPAVDFPELFAEPPPGAGGAGGGFDDLKDFDPNFPSAFEEQSPKPKRRRPQRSAGPVEDLPPIPIHDGPVDDAPPPQETHAPRRRRRAEPRDDDFLPSPGDAEQLAPLDDDLSSPSAGPRGRRAAGRGRPSSDKFDDAPLPADLEDDPAPSSRRSRRGRKEPDQQPAISEAVVEVPEPEAEDEEEPKKKSGGFFGLFRRKKEVEAVSPHLEALQKMSESLRQMPFKLGDITLIDARQQKYSVTDRHEASEAIQILGLLTLIAYQTRATDIHLEPQLEGYDARMRVDGMLVPIVHLPKAEAGRVNGVVKVLCEIDFAGNLGIQEGNYSASAPSRRSDFRVSFTPSVHGQKLAIRILDVANSPQSLDGLGAPRNVVASLNKVMQQNAGMILMCGPTGSGKTTTLYSLIRSIDRKSRNVMTIEDPVEYQIEGVTQSSVDAARGKNFSDMLRAMLRQDPDVLLIGEIRDAESAKIAMQATMTGHLVLSTVHAQDTLNTVFRLLDLGADPNMTASALDLVLAQRLVRVLCPACRRRRRLTDRERARLGQHARDMIHEPGGCDQCLGTGYQGRQALFELLHVTGKLKDVMLQSPTLKRLQESIAGTGFVSLRGHGCQLVAQGVTTFSEIDRVVGAG